MNITVEIKNDNGNYIDRTSLIRKNSISRTDVLNNQSDRMTFEIPVYGQDAEAASQTYYPDAGQEIILKRNGTREFGGVITKTTIDTERNGSRVVRVQCKDWVHTLDRQNILEKYEDQTVNQIIDDLASTYAKSFTTNGVNCDINVATITFNRIKFSKALKKLANLTNFSWYVDANKDIHFFDKNETPAPFDISKNNGKYIPRTLNISKDITQIRNRVTIRGGEETGNPKTETFDGSQSVEIDTGGQAFNLSSKFSEAPTVKVNGQSQTVGLDFIESGDKFDCFWSFQEKYVRFKDSTAPADGDTVKITGTPLFPVIAEVSDPDSVQEHGVYEFFKKYDTITSRDEAVQRAQADLDAYAQEITEGSFDTYEPGLRSGQVIHVDVPGVDQDFLIKRVRFQMLSDDKGQWSVKLQTLKTFDIIEVLQDLLDDEVQDTSEESLLTFRTVRETVGVGDEVISKSKKSGPYYWAPTDPAEEDANTEYIKWNYFTWSG